MDGTIETLISRTNGFSTFLGLVSKTQTKKIVACESENEVKPKLMQSKLFLVIIMLVAVLVLAFPYYGGLFYPKAEKQIVGINKNNLSTIEFSIKGMTCNGCVEHVNYEINKLEGIRSLKTSWENANAVVAFDKSKTTISAIEKVIKSTGYLVTKFISYDAKQNIKNEEGCCNFQK